MMQQLHKLDIRIEIIFIPALNVGETLHRDCVASFCESTLSAVLSVQPL